MKSSDAGPDVCLINKSDYEAVWLEAIAPNEGTGNDRVPVPKIKQGKVSVNRVPGEKIILRFRSAIFDKHQKYLDYVQNGAVKCGDSFVIALNGRRVPYSYLETEIPYVIQAVLPLGNETWTIDFKKNEMVDQRFEYRPAIVKTTGASISTRIFLDEEYSGISGILYSNSDLFNHPTSIGQDFLFVHNPKAQNPLRRGWLSFGTEYWVENNLLRNEKMRGA